MIKAEDILKLTEDEDYLQKIKDLVYKQGYRQAPSSMVHPHYDEIVLGAKTFDIKFSKKIKKDLLNLGYYSGFDKLYDSVRYEIGKMNPIEVQASKDHDRFEISCGNKGNFFPFRIEFIFRIFQKEGYGNLTVATYVNTKKLEDLHEIPKAEFDFSQYFTKYFPFMDTRVKNEITSAMG